MTTTEPDTQLFQELREQTLLLVNQLAGPVRRVSLAAGACTVEVEWDLPDASTAPAAPDPVSAAAARPGDDDAALRITAPLVGTFYRAPEPGAEPFVEVGETVAAGRTLAIVEAMKLMNPIVAEERGRVVAVHPADGEIVEYDQPLFDLVPLGDDD